MRPLLIAGAVCGALFGLNGCSHDKASKWGDALALADGAIEQTAVASLSQGAIMVWSRIVTSEDIDSDQSGLDNTSETRYRVYGQLTLESSRHSASDSSSTGWTDAQTLQTGTRIWLRTENRKNDTGKTFAVQGSGDTPLTTGLRIASDKNGTAIAVWRQYDSYAGTLRSRNVSRVYCAKYNAASGNWDTPVALNTITASVTQQGIEVGEPLNAYEPDIAVDRAGSALAVWRQTGASDGTSIIVARRWRSDQVDWTPAHTLSNAAAGHGADSPRVAMQPDSEGSGFAIWRQYETSQYGGADIERHVVYAARYASASWSTPVRLSDALADAVSPVIAGNNNGKAIAAWQQTDYTLAAGVVTPGATTSVYASRYTNTSWLSTAEEIDTTTTLSANAVTVAIDSGNRYYTAWVQQATPTADAWNNDAKTTIVSKYYYTYWDGKKDVSTWSSAQTVDGNTRFDADMPQLLSDGSNVLLNWRRWREPRGIGGGGHAILARVNGGDTQAVSQADDAYGQSAAIGNDGKMFIGWGATPAIGDGQLLVNIYD